MNRTGSQESRPLSCDEQLALWVSGESVHNSARDECCPDFSCCQPSLLQPPEVRQAFADASPDEREKWLMVFLGSAVPGVYVARG